MASLPHCSLCLLAAIGAVYGAELASPDTYAGRPVTEVRFEPATQPLGPSDLQRVLTLRRGVPLNRTAIREAIKALYNTGQFDSIELDTEPSANGVTVIIRTQPQWFVGPVEVSGKVDSPPNRAEVVTSSRLDLGIPFTDEDLKTATDRVRRLLERNGLYRATIEPEVVRDAQHQQVDITFQIESGKRARLTLPTVTGDTKIPADDVAHDAKYKEILFFPWKPATQEIVQNGLQHIRNAYDKQDRLTASVTLDHSDYLAADNRVRPAIKAEGGPKVKLDAKGAKISKGTLAAV